MNKNRSVLGHVSNLILTDRLEDISVEALGYILSHSQDARVALQEFVRGRWSLHSPGGACADTGHRAET